MSVETEADRLFDLVRERVHDVTVALGQIVINQEDGYHDYNEAFKNTLKESLIALVEIRAKLH